MKFWFYAVLSESQAWYNIAIQADCKQSAIALLNKKFPYATVLEIEQGHLVSQPFVTTKNDPRINGCNVEFLGSQKAVAGQDY